MALPCVEQLASSLKDALCWLKAQCEGPWNKGPLSATGELLLVSITLRRERAEGTWVRRRLEQESRVPPPAPEGSSVPM